MLFNFFDRFQGAAKVSAKPEKKRIETRPHQPVRRLWNTPLWDYAVKVYSHKHIEKICLRLQDDYHANVGIILWCCWLELERIRLSKDALDDVLISIDTVSQSTQLKLRKVRQHINTADSFNSEQSEAISKQLLNAELMIEKILLYRIQDLTRGFMEIMRDPYDPLDLYYYFSFLGIPDGDYLADSILGMSRALLAGSEVV